MADEKRDLFAQPIRKHWIEVAILPKNEHGDWIRVSCPSCNFESPYLALKSSLRPGYLFQCERNNPESPECARLYTLCSCRFSIAESGEKK